LSTEVGSKKYEFPDAAGYPDGAGFLDEGTAMLFTGSEPRQANDPALVSKDGGVEVKLQRDDVHRRYVATVGEREVGNIRYDEVDGRVVVLKTSVLPTFRGRGIATELIAYALRDIRDRGMQITVYCPLVAAFIEGNQQFADLIDPAYPGR
jgi:predicted GNAT family acetyltransferase